MKPLHIALLTIGAAVAGGLAVRMAEPPPLPPAAAVPAPPRAVPKPPPPPVIPAPDLKPSPLKPVREPETVIAPAPPPIYAEPPHVAPRRVTPVQTARLEIPHVEPVPYRPEPAPVTVPPPPVPEPEPPHVELPPRQVILQTGNPITVRLLETLSSENTIIGDTFQATLADPLVLDGLVIAERGARVTGRVADARRAGLLELRLLDFVTSDGQRIPVTTDPWLKRAGSTPVVIPGETVIRFRIASKVTVIERRL